MNQIKREIKQPLKQPYESILTFFFLTGNTLAVSPFGVQYSALLSKSTEPPFIVFNYEYTGPLKYTVFAEI